MSGDRVSTLTAQGCYACKHYPATKYETTFGRVLWFCDPCRDRLSPNLPPLVEA